MDWKGIDTVVINSRVFIDKKDVYSKTFAKETKREEMDSSEMSLCLLVGVSLVLELSKPKSER